MVTPDLVRTLEAERREADRRRDHALVDRLTALLRDFRTDPKRTNR